MTTASWTRKTCLLASVLLLLGFTPQQVESKLRHKEAAKAKATTNRKSQYALLSGLEDGDFDDADEEALNEIYTQDDAPAFAEFPSPAFAFDDEWMGEEETPFEENGVWQSPTRVSNIQTHSQGASAEGSTDLFTTATDVDAANETAPDTLETKHGHPSMFKRGWMAFKRKLGYGKSEEAAKQPDGEDLLEEKRMLKEAIGEKLNRLSQLLTTREFTDFTTRLWRKVQYALLAARHRLRMGFFHVDRNIDEFKRKLGFKYKPRTYWNLRHHDMQQEYETARENKAFHDAIADAKAAMATI